MAEVTVKIDLTQDLINKIADRVVEYGDCQIVTRCCDCKHFSGGKTIGYCCWYDTAVPAHNYCGLAKMRGDK